MNRNTAIVQKKSLSEDDMLTLHKMVVHTAESARVFLQQTALTVSRPFAPNLRRLRRAHVRSGIVYSL
jgi:hypothetical protein